MKRLLIVDNSTQLGHWLRVAVVQMDPQVEAKAFLSGEEALLEGSRSPIDLLITDIRLTGMSGFELIRKIRKLNPLLRVVVLTDLPHAEIKKQLDEIGIDAFFNKPLKVSLLMDAVSVLLKLTENHPGKSAQESTDPQTMKTTVLHPLSPTGQSQSPVSVFPSRPGLGEAAPAQGEKKTSEKILEMLLTRLHKETGALAVLLLSERGQVIGQVGVFPDPAFIRLWAEPLARAAQAGRTISKMMDASKGREEMVFHGDLFDVVMTTIASYPLVLALRTGYTGIRMAFVFEEIQNAHRELLGHLASRPQLPVSQARITSEPIVDKEIKDQPAKPSPTSLASLFKTSPPKVEQVSPSKPDAQPSRPPVEKKPNQALEVVLQHPAKLKPGEADKFWEEAGENATEMGDFPDTLTYDQARDKGLLHDLEES